MDTAMENDRNMRFQGMDIEEIMREMNKKDFKGPKMSGGGPKVKQPKRPKPKVEPTEDADEERVEL